MKKFFKSLRQSRKKQLILLGALLLIIGALVYFFILNKDKYYSQLTGVEVSQEESERPILGIMIENTQEARPQSGLDSAGIVFETVTEGGITRYLAFYQEDMPKDAGPVRSLRPFFVGSVLGFDASVAHAGGSAEALQMVEENDVKTLTQFQYTEPYRRIDTKFAPHNLYVRPAKLMNLQEELGHETSQFEPFERSEDKPGENPRAENIKIDFSSELYAVEFRYDAETNSYTRYLAGEPHIDALTDKPITVKNVIVMKLPGDEITSIGEGEAWIFKDGDVRKTTWSKNELTDRVTFEGSEDNPVTLNRGDSWFAAIPSDKKVTF